MGIIPKTYIQNGNFIINLKKTYNLFKKLDNKQTMESNKNDLRLGPKGSPYPRQPAS
jgi:hypothetical protein